MFDVGWSELLVIGGLALIVIGPKDLPVAMRTAGKYVARMRGMANDFRQTFDQAAREMEMEELAKARQTIADFKSGRILADWEANVDKAASSGHGAGDDPGAVAIEEDPSVAAARRAAEQSRKLEEARKLVAEADAAEAAAKARAERLAQVEASARELEIEAGVTPKPDPKA